MSRLHELITQLCPNGVPYRPLGEISIMTRGTAITRKNCEEGDIPVIAGGQRPAYYCATPNRTTPCVTVAGSGAYAGYVAYWETPIFVSDAFSIIGTNAVATKYLYHILKTQQERIYATKKGSGVPHVHISSIASFRIPVPPRAVQEEIARILDGFAALEAELEAELEARKKQYAYWRERLLSFGQSALAPIVSTVSVNWVPLGEIATITRGGSLQKKDLRDAGVPAFHYGQIYTRYGVSSRETFSYVT